MPTWTDITTTWATEPNTWAGSPPVPPIPVPPGLPRWRFYDSVVDETYVFEINPDSGGSPTYGKRVVKSTTQADRSSLIIEGSPPAQNIDFSGVSLTQTQLEAFVNWFNRRRPIKLTDDLGRQWTVYIRSVEPDRKRNLSEPYEHHYKISTVVLGS